VSDRRSVRDSPTARLRAETPEHRLLFEFDLEARISLDVVDDLVIAGHEFRDRDAAALGAEFPQLIEIEGNELLNLKHVDPVCQVGVDRQPFGDGQTALPGYEDRPKPVVEVVATTLDYRFARRRGDVNGDIAEEKSPLRPDC